MSISIQSFEHASGCTASETFYLCAHSCTGTLGACAPCTCRASLPSIVEWKIIFITAFSISLELSLKTKTPNKRETFHLVCIPTFSRMRRSAADKKESKPKNSITEDFLASAHLGRSMLFAIKIMVNTFKCYGFCNGFLCGK